MNQITAKEIFNELFTGGTGKKIGVGIYENVKLDKVDVTDRYIDFHFLTTEDTKSVEGEPIEKDQVHNNRIWFPDSNNFKSEWLKPGQTKEEFLIESRNLRLRHIVKMMHIFLGPDVLNTFMAPTTKEFAERAAKMITAAKDQHTVNLKLFYDKDGQYSTLQSRYPNNVELYVAGQPTKLKYSDWEKENKLTKKTPALNGDTQSDVPVMDNLV